MMEQSSITKIKLQIDKCFSLKGGGGGGPPSSSASTITTSSSTYEARLYWHSLQQFLMGSLTKEELDEYIQCSLGLENVHLHNQLIHHILNASFQEDHQQQQQQSKPSSHILMKDAIRRNSVCYDANAIHMDHMILDSEEKMRLSESFTEENEEARTKENILEMSAKEPPSIPHTKGVLFDLASYFRLSTTTGKTPGIEEIKYTFMKYAHHFGLEAHIDDVIPKMVKTALENYLKSMIKDAFTLSSTHPFHHSHSGGHGLPLSSLSNSFSSSAELKELSTLLSADALLASAELHPSIYPQNSSYHTLRLNLSCHR